MSNPKLLVDKAATDAGFDRHLDSEGVWWCYGVSGRPLKAYVSGARTGELLVAVSSATVSAELGGQVAAGKGIPGTGAAWSVTSPERLLRLLRRIRLLDTTLPNQLHERFLVAVSGVNSTERDTMVRQRVGQDLFRKGLMDYWEGRCAISGLAVPELLRASHAKPWKDCSDEERLDVHNGLLLAAHLDAAFDAGLITVLADGRVQPAATLSTAALAVLGLQAGARVEELKPAHEPFLAWHREKVFNG